MNRILKSKYLYLAMAMFLLFEIGANTSVASAEIVNSRENQIETQNEEVTQAEMDEVANKLAAAFKKAAQENPEMSGKEVGIGVFEYAIGYTEPPSKSANLILFSFSGFGKCMLTSMGFGFLVNESKTIFNKQVIKLLNSKQWEKAAKLIIKIATKVAKKHGATAAKKVIARLGASLFPGIGWGSLAWYVTKCGFQNR